MTNHAVGAALEHWCQQFEQQCGTAGLSDQQQRCAAHFLKVTQNLRPWLCHCYDTAGLPRTNNALEGFIRRVKARARRISGRKNWNQYLLRYGSRVVYHEAHVSNGMGQSIACAVQGISAAQWRMARAQQAARQGEQLKQIRFRRNRIACLHALEQRWAALSIRTGVLH